MDVAAVRVGVPEAGRRVVAGVLNLESVLALLFADVVVVGRNSAHVVGEAEIFDLSPDQPGVLRESVGFAVVTAFLHGFVPHAVGVTVARGEVGVLEAAADVTDGESSRVSVVVTAAVRSGAFGAVHLTALQDARVFEPFTFFRGAALG